MTTVFVSSTSADLKAHRIAVTREIRARGWTPIVQEEMSKTFETALAASLENVEKADLFIIIVGWLLGQVPDEAPKGAGPYSITQRELFHAQKLGKPCIALVASEVWPDSQKEQEQSRKQAVREFRSNLNAESVVFVYETEDKLPLFHAKLESLLDAYVARRNIASGSKAGEDWARAHFNATDRGWHVEEKIGQGDFGDVFRVRSKSEIFALKIYRPRLAFGRDTQGRYLFWRGAQALRRLASGGPHRNIVQIIEGPHKIDDRLWYTMKLVAGIPLSQYVKDHELDFRGRIQLHQEILSAIAHAHSKSIYHGDLSPQNVIVGDGHAVVHDFDLGGTDEIFGSGTGTGLGGDAEAAAFRSPEALYGAVDQNTQDIWSIGMMLQFLLSGRVATSQSKRLELVNLIPGGKGLAASNIIEWILASDPGSRPQSVAEIVPVIELVAKDDWKSAFSKFPEPVAQNIWAALVFRVGRWTEEKNEEQLWTGDRLSEAQITTKNGAPPAILEFLQASEAYDRKQKTIRVGKTIVSIAVLILLVGLFRFFWVQRAELAEKTALQAQQTKLMQNNVGRFGLLFAPFDWDADKLQAKPIEDIKSLSALRWRLYEADENDPLKKGAPIDAQSSEEEGARLNPARGERAFIVEARGGAALLEIDGRGAGTHCAPSLIPLKKVPGYLERSPGEPPILAIKFPTCQATLAGTTKIPAGEFRFGGRGVPPIPEVITLPSGPMKIESADAETIDLSEYMIQTTEVVNEAFGQFAALSRWTQIEMPEYVSTEYLRGAHEPNYPVTHIDYSTASIFCHYWGLVLPTVEQWEKAARGASNMGATPDEPNERSFPWGTSQVAGLANLGLMEGEDTFFGIAPVRSMPKDASPYGVLGLAGNVHEWTASPSLKDKHQISVRGGSWLLPGKNFVHAISYPNSRPASARDYNLGFRCASKLE